jgi:hypothetical protein
LQGKIVQRRNLHGNEEESKKEETLTVARRYLAYTLKFTGLLREAPLEGLFLFGEHLRTGIQGGEGLGQVRSGVLNNIRRSAKIRMPIGGPVSQ